MICKTCGNEMTSDSKIFTFEVKIFIFGDKTFKYEKLLDKQVNAAACQNCEKGKNIDLKEILR